MGFSMIFKYVQWKNIDYYSILSLGYFVCLQLLNILVNFISMKRGKCAGFLQNFSNVMKNMLAMVLFMYNFRITNFLKYLRYHRSKIFRLIIVCSAYFGI